MQFHLAVIIPCLNEEKTLLTTLQDLPRKINGIDIIDIVVVDDGSTDKTAEIAHTFGCHVVKHKFNRGLGPAFSTGVDKALSLGCNILVNTDGDGQYPGRYIPQLIQPIIDNQADMVVGNRTPWEIKEFSKTKRIFQYIGNAITRKLIRVDVADTVSGFRAYSKDLLCSLNVTTRFSYVLDTLVQAVHKGFKVTTIKIDTNQATRPSRLFSNIFHHMSYSGMNLIRILLIYRPFHLFSCAALGFGVPGIILVGRFFGYYFLGDGTGHVQSLVIAAILLMLSGAMIVIGVVSFLIGINRSILERILENKKRNRYDSSYTEIRKSLNDVE